MPSPPEREARESGLHHFAAGADGKRPASYAAVAAARNRDAGEGWPRRRTRRSRARRQRTFPARDVLTPEQQQSYNEAIDKNIGRPRAR